MAKKVRKSTKKFEILKDLLNVMDSYLYRGIL